MQFVNVTNDVAFRKIFGQQEKKEVLISFLNAVIRLPNNGLVADLSILNPYQLPMLTTGKTTILDVKAIDTNGNTFIVEMQVAHNKHFHKRVLYYTSQSYSQQIKEGEDYSKLFPIYFIGILNFDIGNNNQYFSTHKVLNVETQENVFSDIAFQIIELPKFNKAIHELDNIVDQWIYFIKNATDLTLMPENINDNGLQAAYQEANRGTWSAQELDEYIKAGIKRGDDINALETATEKGIEIGMEKGMEIGMEKGMEIGIKKGKEETALEITTNVIISGYKNKIPIDTLALQTHLTIEQVQQILIEIGLLNK